MSGNGPMNDDSLDGLLRKHFRSGVAGGGANGPQCDGFDANLAAAYAEETLSVLARRDFEEHLAGCGGCRREYSDFALILRVDATPTLQGDPAPTLVARVRDFFASLTSFSGARLAMAAPALAVVLLGGLAWWVVASRTATETSVAMAPTSAAPAPPSSDQSAPSASAAESGAPEAVDRQDPASTTPTVRRPESRSAPRPAPTPRAPSQPARPSRSLSEATRPESDDSVTRSAGTGESTGAPSRIRRAGGKAFILVAGAWTDRDYLARDRSKTYATVTLERGSAAFDSALATTPVLAEYARLDGRVVVLEGASVYTIVGSGPK
jgi:hypothetical protein